MPRTLAWSPIALLLALAACTPSNVVKFRSVPQAAGEDGVKLKATIAKPEGPGPFSAVVLLHGCEGPTRHVTESWPEYLLALGFVVLTVDSFGPRDLGPCPNAIYSGSKSHLEWITGDAYGALDWLAGQPTIDPKRVVVMGFDVSATAINLDMTPRNLRSSQGFQFIAAISLYGLCTPRGQDGKPLAEVSVITYPLMLVIPAYDDRAVYSCTGVTQSWIEPVFVSGAYHGFDQPEHANLRRNAFGTPEQFNATAAARARQAVHDFLSDKMGR